MKKNNGFTLIELMVVIAIIGILSTIVIAILSTTKSQANDSKVKAQLKSMVAQAQLFAGTTGTAYIVPAGASPSSAVITGAAAGGTLASGTLFNDTTLASSGLYNLMNKLPFGTNLYYGWDGNQALSGGKWFVAASITTGAVCVDYAGNLSTWKGIAPSTTANFITAFSNATVAGGYRCL